MTYDPSDRKTVRRLEKAAKQAEAARIAYTKQMMSELLGREWMHQLLLRCNIFSTPFVRGAADVTSFNCGGQNVGLQIFADVVSHCPTEYILMMQEASHKEIVENVRHNRNDRSASGEPAGSEDAGRNSEGSITSEFDPFTDPDGTGGSELPHSE